MRTLALKAVAMWDMDSRKLGRCTRHSANSVSTEGRGVEWILFYLCGLTARICSRFPLSRRFGVLTQCATVSAKRSCGLLHMCLAQDHVKCKHGALVLRVRRASVCRCGQRVKREEGTVPATQRVCSRRKRSLEVCLGTVVMNSK